VNNALDTAATTCHDAYGPSNGAAASSVSDSGTIAAEESQCSQDRLIPDEDVARWRRTRRTSSAPHQS
jgi:hypothetical protein